MSVTEVLNAVLVLALVGFVLYRQTIARPVVVRRQLVLPVVLGVIGIVAISHVDNGKLSATAGEYLGIDLMASLVLGAVRGCFVRVYSRDGVLWRQGGIVTVALWVVSIGVRALVAILASNAGVGGISNAALELTLGVTLLAQNAVIMLRGSRLGIPFAPDGTRRRSRYRSYSE